MAQKVLTTQAELDEIFAKMKRDYGALTKKQEAYAIREIERVRGDVSNLLADYADSDGTIKRRRLRQVLRELDEVEMAMRANGEQALNKIVKESTEFTTENIAPVIGISASQVKIVNEHVFKYIVKRFDANGLVLSERIWGLSGEIRDELSTAIRSNIIKGEGIKSMMKDISSVYSADSWKVRRLARTESTTAHRAATSYNAQESDIVNWVQFHDGRGGHRNHEKHRCYELANEDRYGKGTGIYKPKDTDIWLPHPNCTSYITYIIDERWL